MVNIKNKNILVVAAGPTVKKYWDKIEKFIKDTNPIVIGCNNITHIVEPDIHFWGSAKRWKKYGHLVGKKSNIIFQYNFSKKLIKKHWHGSYETFNFESRKWKFGSDDKNSYQYKRCCIRNKNGKISGCFYEAVAKVLLWSYLNGVSKIDIVGNDGYTFYTKECLEAGKESQHCYGEGHTDGYTYQYCRKKDWDKYKSLRLIYKYAKKKYGFGFSIITPTIFEEFYNFNVLKIQKEYNQQKWKEPLPGEYKYLYYDCLKNRKLEKTIF